MSYCRWSSDDHRSDLYVYADCYGGWAIHVANRRRLIDWDALPPEVEPYDPAAWIARYKAVQPIIEAAELERIELPHAGETIRIGSADECAAKVDELEALGYWVPAGVADAIRADGVEEDTP